MNRLSFGSRSSNRDICYIDGKEQGMGVLFCDREEKFSFGILDTRYCMLKKNPDVSVMADPNHGVSYSFS
jgi:hypothetical protein